MKPLNERNQVREAPQKWREQYRAEKWRGTDKDRILEKLEALDTETATARDLYDIIGNWSWASPEKCDECGAKSWEIIEVGESPDYESSTARLCSECINKAAWITS